MMLLFGMDITGVGTGLALLSPPITFTGSAIRVEVRFGEGLRVGRSNSVETECNDNFR